MIPVEHYVTLSAILFFIGAMGFLFRSNVLTLLMSIEVMLNASNLCLVSFNRAYIEKHDGQMLAFFVIAIAAAEVAVGLAIVISYFRLKRTVYVDAADLLKN